MGIDKTTIDEIVRRVTGVFPAEKIILFGSAATGQMTYDSDIDLLVLKKNGVNRREDWIRIQEALLDMGYPFDIVVMTLDRFEETKALVGGIAYPANKSGKVVYEAA